MTRAEPHFDVIWEVEPPAGADLGSLHAQLDSARPVATAVLVPDSPTSRATASSLAVARRVEEAGTHAIACLNARDRNLLGFRRDLLTSALEGIDDLLLVYGDDPTVGQRASDLTVRAMVEECRHRAAPLRVGVTTRLGPVPAWKGEADQLFVQVSYSLEDLLRWRDQVAFDGSVYPAVLVVPSAAMARRLSARVPQLRVPDPWLAAVERDPRAGVELACQLVEDIRASRAFDGVHLVAGVRHAETAERLRAASPLPLPRSRAPEPVPA